MSKRIIIEIEFLMSAHSNRSSIDHHDQQQHQRKEMVGISSSTQFMASSIAD